MVDLTKMTSFETNGEFTQNYKFLIGSILPRPIAVVSTKSENGANNLAPFSFFTAISAKPMIVAFSPLIRSSTSEMKDTPRNILRTKEFVVNFVTEDTVEKINMASSELAYGEDEFKHAGLTALNSEKVQAMRLKESPIQFECLFRDSLNYGDAGPGSGQLITGEVVKVHIADELLEEGRISTELFKPVGRGAGNDWILCDHRIQIERKMKAQIQK